MKNIFILLHIILKEITKKNLSSRITSLKNIMNKIYLFFFLVRFTFSKETKQKPTH